MATSVVVTCHVTVYDCRVYVVLVLLLRFTPSEEYFTWELLVCESIIVWDIHIRIWATDYRSLTLVLDRLSKYYHVRDMFSPKSIFS